MPTETWIDFKLQTISKNHETSHKTQNTTNPLINAEDEYIVGAVEIYLHMGAQLSTPNFAELIILL